MRRLIRLMGKLLPCLLLLLFACASEDEATQQAPTPSMVEENVAATRPDDQTAGPLIQSTTEGTAAEEANATVAPPPSTPSPVPTMIPLAIERPVADSRVIAGSRVTINGRAQPRGDDDISLVIQMGYQDVFTGHAEPDTAGFWGGVFTVPESISGPATLLAVSTASERTSIPLQIVADERAEGPLLTLERPSPGDVIVAGYIVFFEGFIREPVDQTMTFSLLVDRCTTLAASFELSIAGGDWWGHLILPKNSFTGPACAVATTGSRSAADGIWREVRIPVTMIDAADAEATSLYLGVSGEPVFQAGGRIKLYGGAINAPENEVQLVLTKDAIGPGALLAEGTAPVDPFGYWEAELQSASSWAGTALLTISMGSGDAYTELRTAIEFER